MKSTETENIRIFLDTNILIYAYSETEPEKKEKVLSILECPGLSVSTQVINEFIWSLLQKSEKGPFCHSELVEELRQIKQLEHPSTALG